MSLTTVNVLFEAIAPNGAPAVGARVRAKLTVYETDGTLVVPRVVEGTTGIDGTVVLALWPNARGVNASQYEVSIAAEGRSLFSGLIVVPDAAPEDQPVPARLLLQAVPFPAVDASQQALQQLQAAQASVSAAAAAVLAATVLSRPSAGPVGGGKVLRYTADGAVDIASAAVAGDREVLAGISLTAVSLAGQPVDYRRAGFITDSGWAWTPQLAVYAGVNGVLTQAYSAAWAWVCVVGVAVTPTTVHLTFEPPIFQA